MADNSSYYWAHGANPLERTSSATAPITGSLLMYDGTKMVNANTAANPIPVLYVTTTAASATNAITAFAGGGQSSATALTTTLNRITTCATAGDSVKLPAATAGKTVRVINSGAAYANVFPVTGEVIDTLTANLAVSVPVGQEITFSCEVAGTWISSGLLVMPAKFVTGTTTTTFIAGQLTGGEFVNYTNTGATPGSIATRTATLMFADDPYARVGNSYVVQITNGQGTGTLTVTAGSGVTLTGTATVAVNTTRLFIVTYTSQTALTMQNIGTGTFS